MFSVTATGTAPLHFQWRKEGVLLPQANGVDLSLTNLQASAAGGYSVVVSNALGNMATSNPAILVVNIAVFDAGFNPAVTSRAVPSEINTGGPLALQSDGKILFGYFSGSARTSFVARLTVEGIREAGFHVPADLYFQTAIMQGDGRIVVGGAFTNIAGQTRNRLARLNSNGTLDIGFSSGLTGPSGDLQMPRVNALSHEANGRLLVGGSFTNIAGLAQTNLARLFGEGTGDSSFRPVINGEPNLIHHLSNGKILVSGNFVTPSPSARTNLARFNADGTLDTSFNPPALNGRVSALAVQADDKVLVGSALDSSGSLRNLVSRYNLDGTLDGSFNPRVVGFQQPYRVHSLLVQCDGAIIVGGSFVQAGGEWRTNMTRLLPDGTLDRQFAPYARNSSGSYQVGGISLQGDGKILVSGDFVSLAGRPCTNFGRLLNPEPTTQSLTYDGSAIHWLRGGSCPEVWRTTFEYSSDGAVWNMLGSGSRITNGWQLTEVSVPPGGMVRARGYVSNGRSSWFLETLTKLPPVILSKDSGFGVASNRFGFSALGWPGRELIIEGSTDLTNWFPLRTNVAGSTPLLFIDTNWVEAPQRFYRAKTP